MIERILEQQEAIRVILAQDHKTLHLVLSWQDFDVLQSVMVAVKRFQVLTDFLSGEKRVTCSAIKPLLKVIESLLQMKIVLLLVKSNLASTMISKVGMLALK